jgi:hypothetical protein
MDREPINSDITREDRRFAQYAGDASHLAEQVHDGLHNGDLEDEAFEQLAVDIDRALCLVGVTLRSCDGAELLSIFGQLDIDLQSLLSAEGTSISELMAHDHSNFEVVTEPVTDELPTWTARCRKCGDTRRIVRT